jgi:hypothetical protein
MCQWAHYGLNRHGRLSVGYLIDLSMIDDNQVLSHDIYAKNAKIKSKLDCLPLPGSEALGFGTARRCVIAAFRTHPRAGGHVAPFAVS